MAVKPTKKVIILMGGWTSEAEVSRNSAVFCLESAQNAGYQAELLELSRDLPAQLADKKPDLIFNALHGKMGEDGTVQGVLNLMGIPYTHSGVLASAMAMDKLITRQLVSDAGISVPPLLTLNEKDGRLVPADFTGSHVIKPVNDGSSVGVKIIEADSPAPHKSNWPANSSLMAEAYIPGKELSVAVLNGKALCVTDIQSDGFYDYEAKYSQGGSTHILPADLPEAITKQALRWAETAFAVLGCRGVARADYRYDPDKNTLCMLEVNTQPGMTGTSLVPEQAAFCGINGAELISQLLEMAQCDG